MGKRIRESICVLLLVVISCIFCISETLAMNYVIDSDQSDIKCSITYTLIGKYEPIFEKFEGRLFFDKEKLEKSFVELIIDVDSIKSKHSKLDKIAKSPLLMDANAYKKATFKSSRIYSAASANEYNVEGEFDFHGVKKVVMFSFFLDEIAKVKPYQKQKKVISIIGNWTINRKDFGIIWHDVLDRGGIVVSDDVLIEWSLQAISRLVGNE